MSYQISVIVPVYNQENYLEECLDSIVNQTIGIDNIEVILVNDKSTDRSIDILESYSKKYSSFKIINHEANRGLGEAKNTGMKHITSDYVMFLDSDDFIALDIIENSLKSIKNNDCDMLVFNWERFPKDEPSIHKPNIAKDEIIESISQRPSLVFSTSSWGKIFHRNLYRFLKFPKILYEDNVSTLETMFNSNKIFLSKEVGYYYRKTDNSITNEINIRNPLELAMVIGNLFKLVDVYPEYEKSIKLLILKFIDDILFWSYNYNWFALEEIQIIENLQNNSNVILKGDIDIYDEIVPVALLYPQDILNLKKFDAETFLAKFKYYNLSINKKATAKLYLDVGNGFNESDTIEIDYALEKTNHVKFDLKSFRNIRRLRFDPIGNEFVRICIDSIDSNVEGFEIVSADCDNGLDDDCQIFANLDPYYVIEGDFNDISFISFKFVLSILTKEELNEVFKNKMDNIDKLTNEKNNLNKEIEELKKNSKKSIFSFKR